MVDEKGFDVVDELEIGDLSDVKEEKQLIPPTTNVKLQIRKASAGQNSEGTYRWIKLQLNLLEGIDAGGKYKNKAVFSNVCYYADPAQYTK